MPYADEHSDDAYDEELDIEERLEARDAGDTDEEEDELEECPDCGRFLCVCGDEDTEEERYLDKRLSDREDFHSDESVGPVDYEPYYPEY